MSMISHAFGTLQIAATRAWPLTVLMAAMGAAQAGPVPENLGAGLHRHVHKMMSGQNERTPQARARQRAAVDSSEMMTEDNEEAFFFGHLLTACIRHPLIRSRAR